jgi:hypothetical protein
MNKLPSCFPLLGASVALTFSVMAHAELYRFEHAGRMHTAAGERAALLHVACSPDRDGGALSIELVATEANTKKDFDYNDFEGPDAPAGAKALSHLSWTTAAGKSEMTHTASGWYAPEPTESFMFGINQLSHRREPPAKLLAAFGTSGGRFVWTQTGFDDPKHELVATFDLDAAAAGRVHAAVSSCLPQSMKTTAGM